MKFNKWTLGLAAVGAVSLTSAARADDVTNSLMTAVASTTISGYVDTSINWTPGTGNAFVPQYAYNQNTKADGFNLDSVRVTIAKAEDETEWASGYQVDIFGGPDAGLLGTSGAANNLGGENFGIGQAFVTLRTPIGTGIDWKLGIWDTIIGYESTEIVNNPNFTRSYGYTIEPTSHTGLNGTYKLTDALGLTLGIANTAQPAFVNNRGNPPMAESYKTYMGALSFSAPTNWGAESGSSFYVGFINGFDGNAGNVSQNLYLGTTINTPMTELKVGASYDYFLSKAGEVTPIFGTPAATVPETWANALDLYATYQASDKLSFNTRAEYFWQSSAGGTTAAGPVGNPAVGGNADKIFAITETIEYDLWKNVISRIELRWDHQAGSPTSPSVSGYSGVFGGYPETTPANVVATKFNNYQVIANVIYKF